jgi:hypothetical protein
LLTMDKGERKGAPKIINENEQRIEKNSWNYWGWNEG